jgi:DNA-binding SARP family transcriptional activator
MLSLNLYLLGTPYITVNDQMIEFKRKKALALLAYLSCTGARASRDSLATLLYPDMDEEHARAGLRRTLAAITETAVRPWLIADRQTVALHQAETVMVDVEALTMAVQTQDIAALEQAVHAYRDTFMAGFSLEDSLVFDEWQSQQANLYELKLTQAYDLLITHYRENRMPVLGLETASRWLGRDPYHEGAQLALMQFLSMSNQSASALQHYRRYVQRLHDDLGVAPSTILVDLAHQLEQGQTAGAIPSRVARVEMLPPLPSLLIGREGVMTDLRQRLRPQKAPAEMVIQGYPGIGKTTLSAALAYDRALQADYPDGVLWTALGEQPSLPALLDQWAQALGLQPDSTLDIESQSIRLRTHLAQRAMLIIVDDVWDVSHALPFRLAGSHSATLMTTRFNDVAQALTSRADSLYKLPIISNEAALALIHALAPTLREVDTPDLIELVHDLEGLPLALQVAGRLLHAEMRMGWGIGELVRELRDGRRLLEAQAPADRHEVALQASPTVAALLQRSVVRLSLDLQEKFALLGVFAPKPATFTVSAVQAIWRDSHPQQAIRTLTDRGLLEPSGDGRFQMHALLVIHARSMFQE